MSALAPAGDERAFLIPRGVPSLPRGPAKGLGSITLGALRATDPLTAPLDPLVRRSPRVELDSSAISALKLAWGAEPDEYFPCPLPSHGGRAFLLGEGSEWWLACCEGRKRSLGEVRAAVAYEADRRLSNKEIAAWWRRLAWELHALDPVRLDVPEPPPGAPRATRVLRDGFTLLVGLRRTDYGPEPVAFAIRFAAAWCGLSKHQAHAGIDELRRADIIRIAGWHGQTPLHKPGKGERHGA